MPKVSVFDGNYYMHRAFSIAGKHRNPEHLEKSTLTGFLQSICTTALERRATHVLVCFDSGRSFRKDIYKDYKANRTKNKETTFVQKDGTEFTTTLTPGSLVPTAKKILELSGITHAHKKGYEADDLMACAARSLVSQSAKVTVEVNTRDKDLLGEVNDRVKVWWPREKKLIDAKGVVEYWGVTPDKMLDMLTLIGDEIDNIPGIPNWGQATAGGLLNKYGSLKEALRHKKVQEQLRPHMATLRLARQLVKLKTDISFVLDDLVVEDFENELTDYVWKIPEALKNLGDTRKAASIKGLFSR
jgi:DNA polymerase I